MKVVHRLFQKQLFVLMAWIRIFNVVLKYGLEKKPKNEVVFFFFSFQVTSFTEVREYNNLLIIIL